MLAESARLGRPVCFLGCNPRPARRGSAPRTPVGALRGALELPSLPHPWTLPLIGASPLFPTRSCASSLVPCPATLQSCRPNLLVQSLTQPPAQSGCSRPL